MEFLAQLITLALSFFAWLVFRTFFAVCQAVAGILHPARSDAMARCQKAAVAFLALAVGLLATGFSAALIFQHIALALWLLGPGVAAALIAGVFGHLAEAEFHCHGD